MSSSGKKRGRLVADRRYNAAKIPKNKRTVRKPGAPKRKPAKARTSWFAGLKLRWPFAGKAKPKRAKAAKTPRPKSAPAAKPAAKPKAPKPGRNPIVGIFLALFGWLLRTSWRIGWRLAAVVAMIIGCAVLYDYSTLPDASELVDGRIRGSVILKDRDNHRFASRGDLFGGIVTASTVSPHLKNAIIATEDKRFYRHFGISPRGIASAVRINLAAGRGPLSGNGGSTLTQQTAKLLCLGKPYDPTTGMTEKEYEADCRQGSLWRKIKEAVYAMALEMKYSKDTILTIYLNRAYLGATCNARAIGR